MLHRFDAIDGGCTTPNQMLIYCMVCGSSLIIWHRDFSHRNTSQMCAVYYFPLSSILPHVCLHPSIQPPISLSYPYTAEILDIDPVLISVIWNTQTKGPWDTFIHSVLSQSFFSFHFRCVAVNNTKGQIIYRTTVHLISSHKKG